MRLVCLIIILYALSCPNVAQSRVDTTKAVIHHTASPEWTTVADIDAWHRKRGFDEIGYHIIILANGEVKEGRSLDKQGAHAKGRNDRLGIALVGYDKFNSEQLRSLGRVLKHYDVRDIERHHRECPGDGLDIEKIREEL